jgi:hypothetical protein
VTTSAADDLTNTGADGDDGHVVLDPAPVAEQHTRYQRRVAANETGVAVEIPAGTEAVGVEDKKRVVGPRIGELLDPMDTISSRPVERDHVSRGAVANDRPRNVADAGEGEEAMARLNAGDADRGAPSAAQPLVDIAASCSAGARDRPASKRRRATCAASAAPRP